MQYMVVYELFMSVAVNVLLSMEGIRFSVPQVCNTPTCPYSSPSSACRNSYNAMFV